MGYDRLREEPAPKQPDQAESNVEPQPASSPTQSANEVSNSSRLAKPKRTFREEGTTTSGPGTEYWLP
jgi:hypothetical protein